MRQLIFRLICSLTIISVVNNSFAANPNSYTTKVIKQVDEKNYATISVSYPYFADRTLDAFNQLINNSVNETVVAFKDITASNQKDSPPNPGLPLNATSNTITITYKVINNTSNIISLLFTIDTYYYGAAHPNQTHQSFNYTVKNKQILALGDLFKPGSKYLEQISAYVKTALKHQLTTAAHSRTPISPDENGIKPLANNYSIWNLSQNALLITFPPYQVAPYAFGTQQVSIPYSSLTGFKGIDYLK